MEINIDDSSKIENELGGQFTNDAKREINEPIANYMQLLQDKARDAGIDVPVFHNAPNLVGAVPATGQTHRRTDEVPRTRSRGQMTLSQTLWATLTS